MLCKWSMPSFKDVSMSSVKEILWKGPSQERGIHESNFVKYCNTLTPFSDERIDEFIKKCHSDGDVTALGTIVLPHELQRKTNIKDEIFLASLYNVEYRDKTLSQLISIGKSISLNVTDDEVKEISKITVNKEKSKFFVGLRRGRISGSNFKSCCVSSVENPSITNINSMLNPRHLDNVPSISYQIKNRKKALSDYMRETMFDHESFNYSQCGLIINPRLPYFVGSPDGIVSCTCHGTGCVVLKCFKILASGGSFDVLTAKPNNMLNLTNNIYDLERSHELFYQIQLQINLISFSYCDVVFWSPVDILIIRVEPDVDFWKTEMNKALTFHQQVIMPEILAKIFTKHGGRLSSNFKLLDLLSKTTPNFARIFIKPQNSATTDSSTTNVVRYLVTKLSFLHSRAEKIVLYNGNLSDSIVSKILVSINAFVISIDAYSIALTFHLFRVVIKIVTRRGSSSTHYPNGLQV